MGKSALQLVAGALFVGLVSVQAVDFIYWTDQGTDKVQRARPDGTGLVDLATGLSNPFGIAVDNAAGHIYFTESATVGNGTIKRMDLDGANLTTLVTGLTQVRPIAIDSTNSHMYYADSGSIIRRTLAGGSPTTIFTGSDIEDFELDIPNSKIYYVDDNVKVYASVNFDGTGQTNIRTSLLDPEGLAIDTVNSDAYIVNEGNSNANIIRTGLNNGASATVLVTGFTSGPEDVEIDLANSKMYYTAPGALYENALTGGSQSAVVTGLSNPNDLVLAEQVQFYWDDSSTNGLWATDTNWIDDVAPTPSADVFFEDDYGTGAESVDVNTIPTVRSLNFDNPTAYTLNNNSIKLDATVGTIGIFVDDNNGTPASAITHTINSGVDLGVDAVLENDAASSNVSIELAGAVFLDSHELTVQGAQDSEISGVISGTGGKLSKEGTGTLILSGTNTYTGETDIGSGIVEVQNLSALGTSAGDTTIESGATVAFNLPAFGTVNESFDIEGTGTAGQGALVNSGTQSVFISGNIQLSGDATINAQTAFMRLNGNIILGGDTVTLNADSGSMRTGTSTVISGTGGLIKTGTGFISYGNSSTTHNTYTGLTDVVGGILSTASASDSATIIPGNIKIQSGATLALLHNNNVADTSDVELNGGTLRFQTGGSGSNTITETLDTLTLTDDSSLIFSNLGSSADGALVVSFSDSSGVGWTSGKKLIIEQWDGDFSGGGRNQLFFGSNSSGLSTGQLAQVTFLNPNGLGGFWDAKLLSTGELVPVPEPSTWVFGGLVLAILAYVERRRVLVVWAYLWNKISR